MELAFGDLKSTQALTNPSTSTGEEQKEQIAARSGLLRQVLVLP